MAKKCEHCGAIHEECEKEIAVTSQVESSTRYIIIDDGNSHYIRNIASDISTMRYILMFWLILTIVGLLFGYSAYLDYVEFMEKFKRLF